MFISVLILVLMLVSIGISICSPVMRHRDWTMLELLTATSLSLSLSHCSLSAVSYLPFL